MSKPKLFLDFDNTIVASTCAFAKTYNTIYENYKGFTPANPELSKSWDLRDICPLIKDPLDIFSSQLFFQNLEFMPDAKNIVRELNNKYTVIIATIGSLCNISLKSQWIKDNLPFIKNVILINNEGIVMNKSSINMHNSIFIDDVKNSLDSSNAKIKILFGKTFDYNKEWDGERCLSWQEVYNKIGI